MATATGVSLGEHCSWCPLCSNARLLNLVESPDSDRAVFALVTLVGITKHASREHMSVTFLEAQ